MTPPPPEASAPVANPWLEVLARRRPFEIPFVISVTAVAIGLMVLGSFVLTEGRAAAAFAKPISYARSFFNRDSLAAYGTEGEGPRIISIRFDADTGETRIDTVQVQRAAAAALRPDVIGAADQDRSGSRPGAVQPSATGATGASGASGSGRRP